MIRGLDGIGWIDPIAVQLGLQRLLEGLDVTLFDPYSWTKIKVPPHCERTDEDSAVEAFEDAATDRLLVPNAERAEQERSARNGQAKSATPDKSKKSAQSDAKVPTESAKKQTWKGAREGQGSPFY